MRVKRMAVTVAAIASASLVAACGNGGASAAGSGGSASGANETFTVAVQVLPAQFDPYQVAWGVIMQPLQAAYDTLIHKDTEGNYQPGLATAWSYKDATHFDLTIRSGVKFSDGTPLTPQAVKQNLDRHSTVNGPRTSLLSNVSDVAVTGDDKVELTLSQPDPELPLVLSQNMGMMVSPKALADPSALNQHPVGAGPYTLDSANSVTGDTYVFKKNPTYWDAKDVHFGTLSFKLMTDSTASLNALRSGQIDATVGGKPNVDAAKAAGMSVITHPSYIAGLRIQDRKGTIAPALGDVRVRQALNYAVDRKALQNVLGSGHGTAQLFQDGTGGYVPSLDNAYPYDPAKAKQLLAAAGYGNGLTVDLLSTDIAFFGTYAEAVAQQLAKVGVTLKINNVSDTQWNTDGPTTKTALTSWFYNFTDAYFDGRLLLLPTGTFNPFKVDDPQVDALMTKAATQTVDQRNATMQQISKIVTQNADFLVTNVANSYYYYNPRKVKSVQFTPLEAQPNVTEVLPAS